MRDQSTGPYLHSVRRVIFKSIWFESNRESDSINQIPYLQEIEKENRNYRQYFLEYFSKNVIEDILKYFNPSAAKQATAAAPIIKIQKAAE